jgi:hypothetical protein
VRASSAAALGGVAEIHGEKVQVGSREFGAGGQQFGEAEVPVEPGRVLVAAGDVQVHSPGPLGAQGREQGLGRLTAEGIPEPYATDLPTIHSTVADTGWWDVNQTVQDVTGRPPRTLAQFLADHTSTFHPLP